MLLLNQRATQLRELADAPDCSVEKLYNTYTQFRQERTARSAAIQRRIWIDGPRSIRRSYTSSELMAVAGK